MFGFNGQSRAGTRRVEIRGRSNREESREELLDKARLEREKRKKQKMEEKSATIIKVYWKSWAAKRRTKERLRQEWTEQYGTFAERATVEDLSFKSTFLHHLLFFMDVKSEEDARRLAAVCNLLRANTSVMLGQLTPTGPTLADDARDSVVQALRLRRLALLCLRTLLWQRSTFISVLSNPRPAAAQQQGPAAHQPAATLIETTIMMLSPEQWTGGPHDPAGVLSTLCPSILSSLVQHGMFPVLASLLETSTTAMGSSRSYADYLCTQLTARFLASTGKETLAWYAEQPTGRLGIMQLLCLPLLWKRAPSLAPISTRITKQALLELNPSTSVISAPALVSMLHPDLDGGKACAAAALMGNILSVGSSLLVEKSRAVAASPGHAAQPSTSDPAPCALPSAMTPALQIVRTLQALLHLLPESPFFPPSVSASLHTGGQTHMDTDSGSEDEEDSGLSGGQGQGQSMAGSSNDLHPTSVERLALDKDHRVCAELIDQVQLICKRPGLQLLRQLITVLLPCSSASEQLSAGLFQISSGKAGAGAASGHLRFAEGAYSLCMLLHQIEQIPAYRYFIPLSVAVPANFVERLWFSVLQGCRLAELKSSPGTGTASEAWYDPELRPSSRLSSQDQSTATGVTAADEGGGRMRSATSSGKGASSSGQAQGSGNILGWLLPLQMCTSVFSNQLMTSALDDFYIKQRPLPLLQLYNKECPDAGFVALLRDTLWQMLWIGANKMSNSGAARVVGQKFMSTAGQLYSQLYGRNCRQAFAPTDTFHAPGFVPDRFLKEAAASRSPSGKHQDSERVWKVLKLAPCLIPFEVRAQIFRQEVGEDRRLHREMDIQSFFNPEDPFAQLPMGRSRFVPIRRASLVEDGYERLNKLGEALKGQVRVQFINEHDEVEAGVDGGGLFKDFLEELIKEGFSSQHGLFSVTESQQLYPNPDAVGSQKDSLEFLGRMLGKAMYESILVELPFAGFFLKKFRSTRCDVNDLPTLDPEVYRHLMELNHYSGDVMALDLYFTAATRVNGVNRVVELRPGGQDIAVDNNNVVEYIRLVADFRLNKQMNVPAAAFLTGFFEIIKPEWVSMFNEEELQMLISGSEEALDLEDFKKHTQMAGGYHEDHPVIHNLWAALGSFTAEDQRAFLKFVTACSRPPLLGFKYLEPAFCVQMSGGVLDPSATERLPTAATCMNLLKLPPYPTVELMRNKLLLAIHAGAGFDLS